MGTSPKVARVLLCRPSHFSVEYIINPHMRPHSVDRSRAESQWLTLVDTLIGLDIQVDIIDQHPDVPDMVFATDQGIVRNGTALLANFRYAQRQKERPYYRAWFRDHGFELDELSNVFPFEGGDTLFFDTMLMVGTGFRASVSSCEELSKKLEIDVIPLRLIDPFFYHLDMAFFPLDSDSAFYYPPAFSKNSQHLLKRIVPNLYELSQHDAEHFAANSFVTGDNVVVQTGSPAFVKQLEKLGKKVTEIDVNEFDKAGGGIHCMINTLAFEGSEGKK